MSTGNSAIDPAAPRHSEGPEKIIVSLAILMAFLVFCWWGSTCIKNKGGAGYDFLFSRFSANIWGMYSFAASLSTAAYAAFYYNVANDVSRTIRGLSLFGLVAYLIAALAFKELDDVQYQMFVNVMMYLIFIVFDWAVMESTPNPTEARDAYLSIHYSSGPGILLLLLLILAYDTFTPLNRPSEALAYTCGVLLAILFSTNIIFALLTFDGYGSRVVISLRSEPREKKMLRGLHLVLTGVCTALIGVLAYFAAITVSFMPGVAALYPATAFEAVFGAWFAIWGALASFFGLLIAGSVAGWFAPPVGALLSLSDAVIALATAAGVRLFGVDPSLPNAKHAAGFVSAAMVGSILGSLWYNLIQLKIGQLPSVNAFWVAVAGWNLGNLLVIVLIGIPLMRFATAVVKQLGLYVHRWF